MDLVQFSDDDEHGHENATSAASPSSFTPPPSNQEAAQKLSHFATIKLGGKAINRIRATADTMRIESQHASDTLSFTRAFQPVNRERTKEAWWGVWTTFYTEVCLKE
jgi:hypothetical protein